MNKPKDVCMDHSVEVGKNNFQCRGSCSPKYEAGIWIRRLFLFMTLSPARWYLGRCSRNLTRLDLDIAGRNCARWSTTIASVSYSASSITRYVGEEPNTYLINTFAMIEVMAFG